MHFLDLKRSNAVYIFRAIKFVPKSLKEIATETEIAEITIKKIAYKLIDAKIISKGTLNSNSVGRPLIYLSPNPINFCLLINKTENQYIFYSINTFGKRKKLFDIPLNYQSLSENDTLKFAYHMIARDEIFNYCHSSFLIGTDIDKLDEIDGIIKTSIFDLISQSLINDESAIYLEFGNKKAFINHGKIKHINITKDELVKIVDIDEDYTFNDLDEIKAENEALKIITLNKLEEKVAQLFD